LAKAFRHREGEAMSLAFAVIWVLPDDNGSDCSQRGQRKGSEYIWRRRVDGPSLPLISNELGNGPQEEA
jgi:hypothetical protein